jgi:CRP/FNR family cyclic AMP-dependent transcriptional regulator
MHSTALKKKSKERKQKIGASGVPNLALKNADAKHDENGILRNIALFSSLSNKELHQIRGHVILREFKKNQMILGEEETSQFMYIIVRGKVKISRLGKEGKETILSIHDSGEFFGELALIDGKTTPAGVVAVENSTVAIISKNHFHSLLFTQQKVLENLLQILCSRLREAWQKIEMMNFSDASQRLKMLLNMLAETYGNKTMEGTVLRVKLIHQDMADMTGLTRETVTRVLDKWKKTGEIKILEGKFIRLNPEFYSIQL